MEPRCVKSGFAARSDSPENRYGSVTLHQYFDAIESAPTVVQLFVARNLGSRRGANVAVRRANFACLKRSFWRAHMLAILGGSRSATKRGCPACRSNEVATDRICARTVLPIHGGSGTRTRTAIQHLRPLYIQRPFFGFRRAGLFFLAFEGENRTGDKPKQQSLSRARASRRAVDSR